MSKDKFGKQTEITMRAGSTFTNVIKYFNIESSVTKSVNKLGSVRVAVTA